VIEIYEVTSHQRASGEGRQRHHGSPRRRVHPPMGGRAAIERLLGGALPVHAHIDKVASVGLLL
jgi:hypothetical protein